MVWHLAQHHGTKLKFIGCEIIYREACRLAAETPCRVDLQFLRKGLHDMKRADMQRQLQEAVDAVPADAGYQAIVLGYARCNDGLVGLTARGIPLVIPRAHDCITFFFGGRAAYQEYFDANPGTYFHTTGWCERDDSTVPGSQGGVMAQLGLAETYEQMVEKYGQDNADFIRETLGDGLQNYKRACYIEMGVCDETAFALASEAEAQSRGWQFERRTGDWSLLRRLFHAQWDEQDFLIVPPGKSIVARNDGDVLGME
jgi:hypothetical protein